MTLLDFKGAADFLLCTEKTLRMQYKIWGVPFYKISGMVRFSQHELYGWVESKSHKYDEATNEAVNQ